MKIRGVEQKEYENYNKLCADISSAKSKKEINSLRMASVECMKTHPDIVKKWQDKFQSLAFCPNCGREM